MWKNHLADDRQAEGEDLDKTTYSANYHLHRDNELAESDDQVMKGNIELTKRVSSTVPAMVSSCRAQGSPSI